MKEQNNNGIDFRFSEGFELLYRRTADQLFHIIFRQTGDKSVTQGLVQNIYLKLWERRFELKLDLPVEHYLNRSAKLAALDYLKTASRRKHHLQEILGQQVRVTQETEHAILFDDLKFQINGITDQLPPKCRTVFLLSREEGLNIREISKKLAIAEKTVEAHLTKALKTIRYYLEKKV